MNEEIDKKISELSSELDSLANAKQSLIDQLRQIEIRTHQIVGAIMVLNELKKEKK
jgi:hypothetical protein